MVSGSGNLCQGYYWEVQVLTLEGHNPEDQEQTRSGSKDPNYGTMETQEKWERPKCLHKELSGHLKINRKTYRQSKDRQATKEEYQEIAKATKSRRHR